MKELPLLIPLLSDLFERAVQVLVDPVIHEQLTQSAQDTDDQIASILEAAHVLETPHLREVAIRMFAIQVLQNEPDEVEVVRSYADRRNTLMMEQTKTPQILFDIALDTVKQLQNTLQGPRHS